MRKTCHDIGDEGNSRRQHRVRKLCGHMVDMVALRSRGSHDRRIGDGRTVVSAYCAGHTGGNGNDHKLGIGFRKYGNYDRDKNAESTPGSPRGKSEETAYEKDNGR